METMVDPTELDPQTTKRWCAASRAVIVDVREATEYHMEHIPGALCAPLSFLEAGDFPSGFTGAVVLVCDSGKRSLAAGRELLLGGHQKIFNLAGGIERWRKEGLPTQGARYDEQDFVI